MLIPTLLLLFFTVFTIHSFGQTVSPDSYYKGITKIDPPETSSLYSFEEINVDRSTGKIQVNVPIYTLSNGSYTLPLGFNYSGGGHKVAEIVNEFGLGWSFSGWGSMYRSVNGGFKDEDASVGFHNNSQFRSDMMALADNPSGEFGTSTTQATISQLANNDLAPDIFNYNINGVTGKFHLLSDYSCYELEPSDNIVERVADQHFKIIDTQGNQYVFGGGNSDYVAINLDGSGNVTGETYYIKSIISALQDTIDFVYSNVISNTKTSFSSTKTLDYPVSASGYGSAVNTGSSTLIRRRELISIHFSRGDFIISNGNNISLFNDSRVQSHKVFSLKDKNNNVISKWHIGLGKESSNIDERLKLIKIVIEGDDSSLQDYYSFDYNDSEILPSENSYSRDYWGFANGNSISNFIPTITEGGYTVYGADRNTNATKVLAEILQKVTYPTKGYSEFTYEPNDYYDGTYPNYSDQSVVANSIITQTDYSLNLNFDQYIHIQTTVNKTGNDPGTGSVEIIDNATSNVVFLHGPFVANPTNQQATSCFLSTGNYTVRLKPGYESSVSVDIDYQSASANQVQNLLAGGARIKTIKHSPMDGHAITRNFEYNSSLDPTKSSGVKLDNVEFKYFTTVRYYTPGNCALNSDTKIIIQASADISSGPSVMYSNVREYLSDLTSNNGYTDYEFQVTANPNGFAFTNKTSYANQRGQLLSQKTYREDDVLLNKTEYTYSVLNDGFIQGIEFHVRKSAAVCSTTQLHNGMEADYDYYTYNHYAKRPYLTREESTQYLNGQSIVTWKEYFYDNIPNLFSPSKVTKSSTDYDHVEVLFKYPIDYSPGNSPSSNEAVALKSLIDKNVIVPIEIRSFFITGNSKYCSKAILQIFKNSVLKNSVSTPLLEQIMVMELASPTLSTSLTESSLNGSGQFVFDNNYSLVYEGEYDNQGNIIELTTRDELEKCFGWSSYGRYKTYEVENAIASDAAFTGFERVRDGKFTYSGTLSTNDAYSGERSYDLNGGNIVVSNLDNSQTYIVGYWTKGSVAVNSQSATQLKSNAQGWNYYERQISGITSVTLSGSGLIDEIYIFPNEARISTYTYIPLKGVVSISDTQGESQFFEYDSFGRLRLVKDSDGNILSLSEYNQRP